MGDELPEEEIITKDSLDWSGDVSLRIVATLPATVNLFRVDQLVSALARKRLWLTDAYFAGTTAYVQALRSAAIDGIDVRLLVPNGTDSRYSGRCRSRASCNYSLSNQQRSDQVPESMRSSIPKPKQVCYRRYGGDALGRPASLECAPRYSY
jgi:hypothetical protein